MKVINHDPLAHQPDSFWQHAKAEARVGLRAARIMEENGVSVADTGPKETARQYYRRYYRRRVAPLLAQGLTINGTVRKLRKWPELGALRGYARAKEYRRLRAAERIAQGLTARGKPRKLHRWGNKTAGLSHSERTAIYERERRKRLAAQGLTSRGTAPKRKLLTVPSARELAYREFKASIKIQEAL